MKKSICVLIAGILLLSTASTLYSQDEVVVAPEKNVLKVNTLALIIGAGSVFYEREISDVVSAQLGVGYLNYKIDDFKFTGLVLTPEAKFYIRKNAIDGFYVAPYLRYQKYNFDSDGDSNGSFTGFGGGAAFGRQWIFRKGFVMDLFFGGHYTGSDITIDSGSETPDVTKIDGFKTRVGFSIGFAF